MRFLIIVIVLAGFSCNSKHEQETVVSQPIVENLKEDTVIEIVKKVKKSIEIREKKSSSLSYPETKLEVKKIRNKINKNPISADSLSKVFTDILLNKIIPYWYDTKWSFEGHTNTPKQGEIACGYFVSTTLKHMGLNVNRYKLAQQNPLNEARTLALNNPVINISNETVEENIKAIDKTLQEGIHFIGFASSHVGYILKKDGQLFLIHSNYIGSEGVIIEAIKASEVFSYFNEFHIAEISTNRELLENWLSSTSIRVITE